MSTLGTPREQGFRWPAEWEPQRATWLAWPHNADDWPGKFQGIEWVFCEIIRRLAEVERVGLIVPSEAEGQAALRSIALVGTDVSTWDTGHSGGFTFDVANIMTNPEMVLHHDAVQPVANG